MDDVLQESSTTRQASRKLHACDECKRRKVRCSTGEPCTNCRRDGKKCAYSSPLHKLSATQRRLQQAEQLIQSMEKAWALQNPTVNLRETIQRLETGEQITQISVSEPTTATEQPPETSPTEFSNAEDYEFDESQDFDNTTDGMGFLVAEPSKVGYMGPQSGVAALKFLQTLHHYIPNYSATSPSLDGTEIQDLPTTSPGNISRYMDDYFSIYHTAYPILHEGTFRARASGALAKPRDGSWPLLYNIVLAIGAFVGKTKESNCDVRYYKIARNNLGMDILEKGSLSYVQGLVLTANYLQKRNKPNAGFVLIGIGFSMALAIGLHREFSLQSSSPFTMEIRRRVWWTLFIFVSGAQLTLGRPPVSLVGVNVHLPTNLNDQDLAVDMEKLPDPKDGPTVTSCLIWQIHLANIANKVQVELLTHQIPSNDTAMVLDQEIATWRKNLPPCFSEEVTLDSWFELPKRILIWRSFHLRIVLHRPALFKAITEKHDINTTTGPIHACLAGAEECVHSISVFVEQRDEQVCGLAWYATYWLITASFVQATCFLYDPMNASAPAWKQQLKRAVDCLAKLGTAHNMAFRARDILEKLLEQSDSSSLFDTSTGPRPQHSQQSVFDLWHAGIPSGFPFQLQSIPTQAEPNSYGDEGLSFPWYIQGSSDAELLDATGAVMLQGDSGSAGPYFGDGSWMPA